MSSKPKTHKQIVLETLKAHKREGVTNRELETAAHTRRPEARIYDLIQEGHIIDQRMERVAKGVRVARYFYKGWAPPVPKDNPKPKATSESIETRLVAAQAGLFGHAHALVTPNHYDQERQAA